MDDDDGVVVGGGIDRGLMIELMVMVMVVVVEVMVMVVM